MAEGGGDFSASVLSPMHPRLCNRCDGALVKTHVLSCLHVLCEQCLMYLQDISQGNSKTNDYSIQCPVCHKTVTIDLSGIGPQQKTQSVESPDNIELSWLPITRFKQCGKLGGLNGELSNPTDFCLGANDEIIIADKENHRIQIFHKDGTFKSKIDKQGRKEGNLSFPTMVAFNKTKKEIIVADNGVEGLRLQVFSVDGIFIKKVPCLPLGNIISFPSAMKITSDGIIIILDKSLSFIIALNDEGDQVNRFYTRTHILEVSDFAIHGTELFICDYKGHRIAVFSMDGVFQRYIGSEDSFSYPSGIHVDDNDIFVSNSNENRFQVARFAPNGVFKALYKCMTMKVSHCRGLVMNSERHFVTVSKKHNCLFIIDKVAFTQDIVNI